MLSHRAVLIILLPQGSHVVGSWKRSLKQKGKQGNEETERGESRRHICSVLLNGQKHLQYMDVRVTLRCRELTNEIDINKSRECGSCELQLN